MSEMAQVMAYIPTTIIVFIITNLILIPIIILLTKHPI